MASVIGRRNHEHVMNNCSKAFDICTLLHCFAGVFVRGSVSSDKAFSVDELTSGEDVSRQDYLGPLVSPEEALPVADSIPTSS